jgi:hypothetical protein
MSLIEEMKEKMPTKDFIQYLIDETHYNLNDGMSIPGVARKFSTDEYELINGIFELIRNKINRWVD